MGVYLASVYVKNDNGDNEQYDGKLFYQLIRMCLASKPSRHRASTFQPDLAGFINFDMPNVNMESKSAGEFSF